MISTQNLSAITNGINKRCLLKNSISRFISIGKKVSTIFSRYTFAQTMIVLKPNAVSPQGPFTTGDVTNVLIGIENVGDLNQGLVQSLDSFNRKIQGQISEFSTTKKSPPQVQS